MNTIMKWTGVLTMLVGLLLPACENGGGGGLTNDDPGDNDPNLYVAMGDSFTHNDGSPFPNYPERLAGLIGKTVINAGSDGEWAVSGADRVGGVLDEFKPGFLLILYGMNDTINGASTEGTTANVQSIVQQARANQTVPVVATYPIPVGDHEIYAHSVKDLNERLRSMAAAEGVALVDLEAAFGEDDAHLLNSDGLHPNDEGTQLMAETFADVLQ